MSSDGIVMHEVLLPSIILHGGAYVSCFFTVD